MFSQPSHRRNACSGVGVRYSGFVNSFTVYESNIFHFEQHFCHFTISLALRNRCLKLVANITNTKIKLKENTTKLWNSAVLSYCSDVPLCALQHLTVKIRTQRPLRVGVKFFSFSSAVGYSYVGAAVVVAEAMEVLIWPNIQSAHTSVVERVSE